jgi:hypothetical protein
LASHRLSLECIHGDAITQITRLPAMEVLVRPGNSDPRRDFGRRPGPSCALLALLRGRCNHAGPRAFAPSVIKCSPLSLSSPAS